MQFFLKYIFLCVDYMFIRVLHTLTCFMFQSHSGNRSSCTSSTTTGRKDPKRIIPYSQDAPINQKLPSALWAGCVPTPQSFYRVRKPLVMVCIYFPCFLLFLEYESSCFYLEQSLPRDNILCMCYFRHEKINWKWCPSRNIIHFSFTSNCVLQKHILHHVYHSFSWVRISLAFSAAFPLKC